MKKLIALLLSTALILTIAGCANKKNRDYEDEFDLYSEESEDKKGSNLPAVSDSSPVTPPSQHKVEKAKEVDDSIRENLNLFLSNFSEQDFYARRSDAFYINTANDFDLIDFAITFHKFNGYNYSCETIDYVTYYCYPISMINTHLDRFFGITLSTDRINAAINARQHYIVYNDMVCHEVADGATLFRMSVAETIQNLGDGTYKVNFSVFEATEEAFEKDIIQIGGIIDDKSVYTYDSHFAAKSPYFEFSYNGWAIVRPHVYKNTNSYQLIKYKIEN